MCLPPYDNSLCHKVAHFSFSMRQTLRGRCGLSGFALQSNSTNCLVLKLHRQLGNYLLDTGDSYGLTGQHLQDFIKVSVWHLLIKYQLTEAQYRMLHRILVLICSSDIGGKIVSSWCRKYGIVTHIQDGHQGNTSCQGYRCWSIPERSQRHMYMSSTENFPHPRRNGYSTDWLALPIITQEQRYYKWSIWLLPERLSTVQISIQIKYRVKINTGMRINKYLRRKMTQLIYLATRCRNENSSMMLKKKVPNINAEPS